ncbi:MAG: cytochrome c [Rubripirellula sp.]
MMILKRAVAAIFLTLGFALVTHLCADERRAPAPSYTPDQLRGVFFENLDDAFRGERPTLSAVRSSAVTAAAAVPVKGGAGSEGSEGDDLWSPLISPTSMEDEIKRVKLHFDSVVTTPGAFNSGGYQEARLDLTVLATLFAVIHQYKGEVRWKDQAAAARDLIARTAFNCKAGSTQVYNEAKLRKGDLQDLVSGSGLSSREAEVETDWTMVADRSPLMEYAEILIETLEDGSRDEATIKRDPDLVKRNSELLAILGEVLTQEGMDEADDEDYAKLSRDMTAAAKEVTAAIDRMDFEAVRKGTSAVRQRCDACHEQYR